MLLIFVTSFNQASFVRQYSHQVANLTISLLAFYLDILNF